MPTFPEGATSGQILTFFSITMFALVILVWYSWGLIRKISLPKPRPLEPPQEEPERPRRPPRQPRAKSTHRATPSESSTALTLFNGRNTSPSGNYNQDDDKDDGVNTDIYDETFMYGGGEMNNQPNKPLNVIGEVRHVPGWIVLTIALITRLFLLPVDIPPGRIGNIMGLWDWRWQLFFFFCSAGIWYYRRISRTPRNLDGVLNGALIFWSIIIVLL